MIKIQFRYAFIRKGDPYGGLTFAIYDSTSVHDPTDIYISVYIRDAAIPDYQRDIKEAERM